MKSHSKDDPCSCPSTFAFPARYVFTLLGFLGIVHVYAMRINLSVAMVAMVRSSSGLTPSTTIACVELLPNMGNGTASSIVLQSAGEFDWDTSTQSIILGSFFYGYILTQIPGGVLAGKGFAKWLFGFGVLVTSVFTILTPWAARHSVTTFILVRVVEGLAEGVTYPAMNALIARWVPKLERSRLSSFINTGNSVGSVLAMAISGVLSSSHFMGGWPSIFYLFGTSGCIWFVFWAFLIYEKPSDHPRITQSELMHILGGQDDFKKKKSQIPWLSILSSVPVWALAITHFGENWGFYTLLTEMPTYLSNVLHFDLEKNGLLSAVPYVAHTIFALTASFFADSMRESGRFSITTIRKIINTGAFFGPAVCILLVAFFGCQQLLIVILLCIAMGLNGAVYSGFNVTHVDMSPEFAGILMGITNCVSNFSGFLAPFAVGQITEGGQTLRNWGLVFVITAMVYIITGLVYAIFCSAELQPWDTNYTSQNSDSKRNRVIPEGTSKTNSISTIVISSEV